MDTVAPMTFAPRAPLGPGCLVLQDDRIREVSCGGFHTAAISESGELFTWGGGEHGQLGHGDKVNKTVPCAVMALRDHIIVQVRRVRVALAAAGSARMMPTTRRVPLKAKANTRVDSHYAIKT